MLDEAGYSCTYYDPFFLSGLARRSAGISVWLPSALNTFLRQPAEMKLLTALLRAHGTLTVMTHRWDEETDFSPGGTRATDPMFPFFTARLSDYLCSRFGYQVEEVASDKVIVLRKMVVV